MSALKPKDLIASNINLVSLPEIVAELNRMIGDPKTAAADIALKIGQDPALTARLLRIVNSPLYNFPSKIDTVSMAITVLGTKQLKDLVVASAVIKRFRNDVDAYLDFEIFWCHSVTSAIAAKKIGQYIRYPETERLFVSGLLHDIGLMIMHLTMKDKYAQLVQSEKNSTTHESLEEKLFGFTHSELGAELLRAWLLPESLIEPVACHHNIAAAQHYPKETAIVHIANHIANNLQTVISKEDDSLLDETAMAAININHNKIESLHEDVYRHLDDLLQIFYYELAA